MVKTGDAKIGELDVDLYEQWEGLPRSCPEGIGRPKLRRHAAYGGGELLGSGISACPHP
jgi:hypothetical protein